MARPPRRYQGLRATVLALASLFVIGLTPAAAGDDEQFVVIEAGRVIPIDGDEIAGGTVILVDGRIRSVGKGIEYPGNATVISAPGETVMPGWIHPRTRWGLASYTRTGVHGDLSAASEYFPEEGQFQDLLEAGYTLVTLFPAGTGAPGRSVVLRTAGPDDARTVASPSYLRVTFHSVPRDKKTLRGALEKARQEIEKVDKARKEFEEKQKAAQAKEQQEKESSSQPARQEGGSTPPATQPAASQPAKPEFKPPEIDPSHRVFVDLIQQKEGVFALVEVATPSELLHLDDALVGFDFAHHLFLPGSYSSDVTRLANKLGESQRQVVTYAALGRVPYTATRLSIAARLAGAGCQVTLMPRRDTRFGLRAFRSELAELWRSGMPREDVLKGVTLHPAELLGLDQQYGSLTKDKAGDLVFFDGDPLDPLSRVTRVMVAGQIVYQREDQNR